MYQAPSINSKSTHSFYLATQSTSSSFKGLLKGFLLEDRFLVGSKIGEGSFGMVCKVMDRSTGSKTPLALKISTHHDQLQNEVAVLDEIAEFLNQSSKYYHLSTCLPSCLHLGTLNTPDSTFCEFQPDN